MSVLDDLFGSSSASLTVADGYAHGYAKVGSQEVCVFATMGGTYIDNAGALVLSGHVLDCVESKPGIPIVMLVDSKGQSPSRSAEMLGLASYFGHLLSCLELARQGGHPLLTVATGEAVGGAFVCYGMFADRIYALESATVGLMPLNAMAAVTKIPEATLEALSKTMPALEFGVDAFATLGGAVAVWSAQDDVASRLAQAIADSANDDNRAALGKARGGRLRALDVQEKVLSESAQ